MLLAPLDQANFTLHVRWLGLAVGLLVACAAAYGTQWAARGAAPGGGSYLGLVLGTLAAVIIGFELLLWPRKKYGTGKPGAARTRRWGRTTCWMAAHVWLGLAVGPLAFLHAGGRLGGALPTVLMGCLVLVVASGVYGLYLQWALPARLLREVPDEVPAVEAERMLAVHTAELAGRLPAPGSRPPAGDLGSQFGTRFGPFLAGRARDRELGCPRRAAAAFARLLAAVAAPDGALVDDIARLCDLRRQFDTQARLHRRLHQWVPVHLALSVVLFGLLVAHIATAVRFI